MLRGDCKYTECYCEENIWWICHSLANGVTDERICDAEVIFISNDARTVPLWCQKSARNPDAPVVWDYHVILAMKKDSEMFIYDLDTSLPFPCEFNDYSSQSFRSDSTLKPQYHRKFRVISGSQFLLYFASDRSHMEKEEGYSVDIMDISIYSINKENHIDKSGTDFNLTSTVSIPDVCQHRPLHHYDLNSKQTLESIAESSTCKHDHIITDKQERSCLLSHTSDSKASNQSEPPCTAADDRSRTRSTSETDGSCAPTASDIGLIYNEEKITLVTSQAFHTRRNSLRLVSKSPKVGKRHTPITELDRRWALVQCEELTTWVNSILQRRGESLESDLKKSMSEGRTLPLLVGTLFGDYQISDKLAKNQREQLETTHSCVQHLKDLGYNCAADVTALDLVNGDLKAVILFLSGLKHFSEERLDQKSELNTEKEDMKPVTSLRTLSSSRERITPQSQVADSSSITDKLKRILKDVPHTGGVNVDSGEQESGDVYNNRGQPSGESDSAASPHSNNEDSLGKRVNRAYQHQLQHQLQQQHGYAQDNHSQCEGRQLPDMYNSLDMECSMSQRYANPHPRYSKSEVHTLPHSRQPQEQVMYNKSVPNLHSYLTRDQVRAAPRSMTPTPAGSKLSVYSHTNYHQPAIQRCAINNAGMHDSSNAENTSTGFHDNCVNTSTGFHDNCAITPEVSPRTKPDLYAPNSVAQRTCRSSYTERRPLQMSSPSQGPGQGQGDYETIDELKLESATNTPTSSTSTSSTSATTTVNETRAKPQLPDYQSAIRSTDQSAVRLESQVPADGIPPDVKYDSSHRRRLSMPATRHSRCAAKTKPAVHARRPVSLTQELRDQLYESDDDYVDISDIEGNTGAGEDNNKHRVATPPLPTLLLGDENSGSGSCGSDDQLQATYKYRRSVSASPKMLSVGVSKFQQKMRQAREHSRADGLVEETVEGVGAKNAASTPSDIPVSVREAVDMYHTANRTNAHQYTEGENSRGRRSEDRAYEERADNYHKYDSKIERQVQKLERLYTDMTHYFTESKQTSSRRLRDGRRNSTASLNSCSQYSYSHRQKKQRGVPTDVKVVQKRFQRLEGHIFTIAKSISHLSSEMKSVSSLVMEVERLSRELELVKQQLYYQQRSGLNKTGGVQLTPAQPMFPDTDLADTGVGETTPHKISKLTRFFGQEPPLMKIFLKELGYEKYLPLFEREKIGVMELPYMTEERLLGLGLPLGPCVRILQEAGKYSSSTRHKQQQQLSQKNQLV